ncbi:hypothetical protein DFR60_12078 [Hungatella effluvii]|uniref:Uncharacterized protein n=1 Tax=Hungatella effluvii TaxID=1096246 RepID=A0A2V3XWK4_9FIRM|nr:hypothetical protein DFR60_12078 [Hungatella effluvii]
MSIAKMSMLDNSYRYFTVTVDRYERQCMEGIISHAGEPLCIRYGNFLELVLQMNQIFDRMSCPKQTMEFRQFSGTDYPALKVKKCKKAYKGKLATFQIYVKFRYDASWQGNITWLEGERTEHFESILQMIQLIDEILIGRYRIKDPRKGARTCQVAVNSYDSGLLEGSVQNAFINHLEEFKGTIGLADAMVHLFEVGIGRSASGIAPGECKIISEETWGTYRKGGRRATFVIKILYREHSTWQGVICWRETGEKQAFRSFLEMIILMASALESGRRENECEDRYYTDNRQKTIKEG